MRRRTTGVVAVLCVLGAAAVGGVAWVLRAGPEGPPDDDLGERLADLGTFPLADYLPDAGERGGLDEQTRQAVGLLEELLPELQKRWPGRAVPLEDRVLGDGARRVRLRLERSVTVEVGQAGEAGPFVTLASAAGADPATVRLGRREGGRVVALGGGEEVRQELAALPRLRGVCVLSRDPSAPPVELLDLIGPKVEPAEVEVKDRPGGGGDAAGVRRFEVTTRSAAYEVSLRREAGKWKIYRIRETP